MEPFVRNCSFYIYRLSGYERESTGTIADAGFSPVGECPIFQIASYSQKFDFGSLKLEISIDAFECALRSVNRSILQLALGRHLASIRS